MNVIYRRNIRSISTNIIRCASSWQKQQPREGLRSGSSFREGGQQGSTGGQREVAGQQPPPEFRHRQYLLALAKANVLPRLLDDEPRLREMGIPKSEYARLMRKPENHGMKGFESAKKLLYMESAYEEEEVVAPASIDRASREARLAVARQQRTVAREEKQPVQPQASGAEPESSIESYLQSKFDIDVPADEGTSYRVLCPKCHGGTGGEKSLSVTIDRELHVAKWNCFRATCGYSGGYTVGDDVYSKAFQSTRKKGSKKGQQPVVRPQVELEPLTQEMLDFFSSRGISQDTLERNRISSIHAYDPMTKEKSNIIGFPYFSHDLLVNIKYRTLDKRFWQVKGAEKVLYGLNDVVGKNEIIIVEGEMDKLALEEAGITNVVSVPDGAPARVKEGELPPADEDTKYSYLWNSRAWLDQAVRIVIATDNDAPGDALAEELARRLGKERCWRVRWPFTKQDHDFVAIPYGDDQSEVGSDESSLQNDSAWYRKDANEVLMKDGPQMLQNFIESAEPFPIRGLLRFHEYYDDIMKYYYLELKDGQGVKTGWPSLDKYYRVVPGELTIVTGVPNSGKSEWIDALLCNLSEQQGWQFAMCSMEKRATDHARQLAEKYVGKPFFDLPYSKGTPRMTYDELDSALDWVDDRFHLIRYEDDELPSVDWVLDIARAAVYRYGIRGLVIDPYNELDHQRPSSMSETEYVSKMLTKVKRFAQTAGVHVWFVAHPRQLHQWKGEAPNLYDISGSAHFINKADNGIVIHRNRDPESESPDSVEILVRKVRNKAAGTIGNCALSYDRRNGRYLDIEDSSPPRTSQIMRSSSGEGSSPPELTSGYFVNEDGTVNF